MNREIILIMIKVLNYYGQESQAGKVLSLEGTMYKGSKNDEHLI